MARTAPKYQTIKAYLVEAIRSRGFTDVVPSENQLAEKFGVSRMTARRALDELVREGSVQRIPGKGTFVSRTEHYTSGFFRVRPFRKWAEDLQVKLTTRVLEAAVVDPPATVAAELNLTGTAIRLRLINFFDGKPVRYEVRYLRADQCAGILWEDLEHRSIHEILINAYHLPLTRITQSMTAIAIPEDLAELFRVAPGTPVFHFRRLVFSFDQPVTYVEYFMRGDMAFKDTFTPNLDRSDFGA